MHRRLILLAGQARGALTGAILSGVLAGMCGLGQAYFLSSTIDAIFLGHQSLARVFGWIQFLLLIIIGRGLLIWFQEISSNEVAVRVKTNLRQRLFGHLLHLGPAFSRTEHSGELTTTAVEGIEALDAYFRQYVPQLIIGTLVPLGILLVVSSIDPLSGAILLLTAPLIPFFMYMIGRSAEAATRRQYDTLGILSSHFLDSLQGLTTLKLFGQSKAQAARIARICDQFRDATLKVLQVSFLSAFALELLATISTAIIAVEVGLRLLYAQMDFTEALFILILAPEFYLPLRLLGSRFHAGMAGTAAARRIFRILDTPAPSQGHAPEITGPDEFTPAPSADRSMIPRQAISAPAIAFSNVSYTHPGRTESVLENIDLTIWAGQRVALVGRSGAGKTTLIHLLLGFMSPSTGTITVNGIQISPMSPGDQVTRIAWVPQDPYLFHDSIAANIRLGAPDAPLDAVTRAARASHLEEFIESLPERYETVIGEGGARLSSGEAQRLALARAFLLDAPILILDEPTSSLDPENESRLEASIIALTRGRTVITIAHRLGTIREADEIVVLDGGRAVEIGTHDELLAKDGVYTSLVRAGSEDWLEEPSGLESEVAARLPDVAPFGRGMLRPLEYAPLSDLQVGAAAEAATPSGEQPILSRLLRFLNGSWGLVALSAGIASLTIGSSVALMGTSAWLISAAALHPSIAALNIAIVGVRFFGLARAVFRYLERLISHGVTFRLLRNVRVWFFENLEPLAPARLMDYRSGDLLARVTADVETLENLYVRVLAPSLTAFCVGVGCFLFFVLNRATPVGLVVVGFFLLVGVALPGLAAATGGRIGSTLVDVRAKLHTQIVDGIQGMADVLAFGRAGDRLAALRATGDEYAAAQRCMARLSGQNSAAQNVLVNLAVWFVLILAIPLASNGMVSGVILASLILIAAASFEAVGPLPLAAQMWPMTREAGKRLFAVVETAPAVHLTPAPPGPTRPALAGSVASAARRAAPEVELFHVSMTYPGKTEPAVSDVSFHIPAAGSLCIVGPSGAGKSSVANLLLRFWEYDSGEICLDGRSLRTISGDQVRAQVGLVAQHAYFFDTSILENLRLARRGASQREIEQAACDAEIHDLISSLPRGYDTRIGEHGMQLSAGERQRLAIARVLIKDAPILILDEPTANLDAATERQVFSTLFRIMRTKTTLLITHRPVRLADVDGILVMNHGAVVERGTHVQLLARSEVYRRLWALDGIPQSGGG